MKCPTCQEEITNKKYNYCPNCGMHLTEGAEYVGPYSDRIRYLWEREDGGKFLHSNFKSMRDMGVISFRKSKPMRKKLGDFSHINLLNLQIFSFLYLNPASTDRMYKITELLGHYSTENLKVIGVDKVVNALSRTKLFWKVFQNKNVRMVHEQGWKNTKIALVELSKVDINKKELVYVVKDSFHAPIKSTKPCCFMIASTISSQAESFYNGFWSGVETKCVCKGDPYCEIKLSYHKNEREPHIPTFTKKDFESILNQLINMLTERGVAYRTIGDFLHFFGPQGVNYLLNSSSHGHVILSKYSGVLAGKRIAEKVGLKDDKAALDYASHLFLYLKAGILHPPEIKQNQMNLRMDESVYSSGVNNINMKLDTFLAGILEGLLSQSTGEKWQVNETKCLANGDDYCQFTCRRQTR